MSRARSCRCHPRDQRRESKLTAAGDLVAVACNACMRFVFQVCRVCRGEFRDLALHLAKSECGRFDKAGMWWTADRPPHAGSPPRNGVNLSFPAVSGE